MSLFLNFVNDLLRRAKNCVQCLGLFLKHQNSNETAIFFNNIIRKGKTLHVLKLNIVFPPLYTLPFHVY